MLEAKRHVALGTIYSSTMLCLLLAYCAASPYRGRADHHLLTRRKCLIQSHIKKHNYPFNSTPVMGLFQCGLVTFLCQSLCQTRPVQDEMGLVRRGLERLEFFNEVKSGAARDICQSKYTMSSADSSGSRAITYSF